MDLLKKTVNLLRFYNILPKKSLGQNFVVTSDLLQKMISHASINREDVVLEIGAGLGFLTSLLAHKCKGVIAVELDNKLNTILKNKIRCFPNVNLIEGDILRVSVPYFNKVVSTPPYSISAPILFWLLERKFDCAVLTFQKEFTDRLVASIGSKEYGRMTVSIYYFAEVELLDNAPKNMFYPIPDVDSMVVRLKPRKPPFFVKDRETFFELLQTLFTQRNRKIRNAIIPFLRRKGMKRRKVKDLVDSLPFHDKRVRKLAPEDFGFLSNEIAQIKCRGDC